MLDLKPYFDAVNAAEAEVQRIANELDTLFREETEESKAKALDLRPALDEAQKKHAEAVALYESMQKANRPNDVAKNFVPVSTTQPGEGESSQPSVIKRKEYDALMPLDRAKFIRSGGIVED
jgi:ElaB/YqjD/DUF883 family membrane-anchored ribosome-binding protein